MTRSLTSPLCASLDTRGFVINLLLPAGNGPVQGMLERDSEEPFEVKSMVEDLGTARRALSGIEFMENAVQGELRPPTDASLGAPGVHQACVTLRGRAPITFISVTIPLVFDLCLRSW